MIAEIGLAALWLAAALAALHLLGGFLGASGGKGELNGLVRPAAVLQALLCGVAFICLLWVFAITDLSVKLVAMNSHSMKPLIFKISGAGGNHEGSMLLWITVMSVAGGLIALVERRLPERTIGDILAQVSACVTGVRRTQERLMLAGLPVIAACTCQGA